MRMNKFILTLGVMAFSIQMSPGVAQPTSAPTYEVQVKRLPADNQGNYNNNSNPSRPYIELDQRGDTNRPRSADRLDTDGYYNKNSNQAGFNKSEYDQRLNSAVKDVPNGVDTRPYANDNVQSNVRLQTPNTNQDNYRAADYTNQSQNKVERTLAIIKPDAVKNNHIGDIVTRYEKAGLRVAAIEMRQLSKDDASEFYATHKDRPFYNDLVTFMSSGPVVLVVLEGTNAIAKNRQLMGGTDPRQADRGTIRADYANSTTQNAVHGSDTPENAKKEIDDFFDNDEIFNRY
jgi:nucleoside-diphosphate kinase